MAVEINDPAEKRLRETYVIECKVLVKEIGYVDEQSKENIQTTDEMVYLVPKHSTQMELFFHAWLPEDPDAHMEIAMLCGHPIYGYFKGAVMRRNKNCNEHHIFVMSKGAEEDLKMMKNKTIRIEVLSIDQEKLADNMKDFTLSGNRAAEIMEVDTKLPSVLEN
jgi:hypothetical protein